MISALIELLGAYMVLVVLDVALAWVQPDPTRPPRRWTHVLTEPPQAMIRRLLRPSRTGGWDLSPMVVLGLLGALRVFLLLP